MGNQRETRNSPLKVLVLTSSTGSGHDMRAVAFKKWVQKLHGNTVDVRIEHIIENASPIGKFGVWIYNSIQKRLPALHNIYFFIVEVFTMFHAAGVTYGGKYYRNLLKEYRPDVILSVHDSTNRGYFEDARKILGTKVRCVTYCGEFFGGYGYSRNWVNPTADLFIARTHTAMEKAINLGVPRENCTVFHKFLPPEAFEAKVPDSEKSTIRQSIGLHPKKFTLFLATGGYGANHHLKFLKAIKPIEQHLQVIAVCGRNKEVLEDLRNWKGENPQLSLFVEGYSENMHKYLQISHAIVSRGGANTTMEALHFQCPILYNTLGGLMPQEFCTVRYFQKHGAARLLKKPSDLTHYLADWLNLGLEYENARAQLSRLNPQELPHSLVKMILNTSH